MRTTPAVAGGKSGKPEISTGHQLLALFREESGAAPEVNKESDMSKQAMTGDQIKAGDSLYHYIDGGHVGDVLSVRPYTGSLIDVLGEGSQIGAFYGGKEMTLPSVSTWLVERA